ncbi:unnamed protein product [Trifolium pratense]|uniref:Uncharacterized protein n=1 Tax=Trifolium pratense TaxID=57577 RepID=A0ACB0KB37_TRIPR|nr:unnamed protein product [Trifolium pratense]
MSGKEFLECQGKNKRVADVIRNSSQEAPTNNSPAKPLKKRQRPEVSSLPSVHFPKWSQPSSSEDMGVDGARTSFLTEINGSGDGDETLIRDLIDKHFGKEKVHEKAKEMGLEWELQNSMAYCIHMTFLLRVIGGMFGDIEKENKAFVGEIMELKTLTTSLKGEQEKLKKTLEESIVEKSQLVARGKNLIEENYKLLLSTTTTMATQIFGRLLPKTLTSLTSFRSLSTRATIYSLIKRLHHSPNSSTLQLRNGYDYYRTTVVMQKHGIPFGDLRSRVKIIHDYVKNLANLVGR